MGYYSLFCFCISCKAPILCNPDLVPSLRVNGEKEPVCEACVHKWNTLHPDKHFTIPKGAYKPAKEYGIACLDDDELFVGKNDEFIVDDEHQKEYYHDFDDKDEDNE